MKMILTIKYSISDNFKRTRKTLDVEKTLPQV